MASLLQQIKGFFAQLGQELQVLPICFLTPVELCGDTGWF
jgi:hypothetical protein